MFNKILVTLPIIVCSYSVQAEAKTYYGSGYTIIDEKISNLDDINQQIYIRLYKNVTTVKYALIDILKGTGYRLAASSSADPEIERLYKQPLPDFKRQVGPMPLAKALEMISGKSWRLVVDDVNKLVSFELHEKYKCFTKGVELCPL